MYGLEVFGPFIILVVWIGRLHLRIKAHERASKEYGEKAALSEARQNLILDLLVNRETKDPRWWDAREQDARDLDVAIAKYPDADKRNLEMIVAFARSQVGVVRQAHTGER